MSEPATQHDDESERETIEAPVDRLRDLLPSWDTACPECLFRSRGTVKGDPSTRACTNSDCGTHAFGPDDAEYCIMCNGDVGPDRMVCVSCALHGDVPFDPDAGGGGGWR